MAFELTQINFAILVNIFFLSVFLWTNAVFDRKTTRYFIICIALLLVLTVTESVDYALGNYPECVKFRTAMAMLGYMIRPWLIYIMILVVKYETLKERFVFAIPAVLNVLAESTALFSGLAFYYDEAGVLRHGPLGYSPHICSALYIILFLIFAAQFFKERDYMEAGIILGIVIVCVIATAIESFTDHQGMLRASSTLSLTFFYLYFCAQSFKRDALTKVSNRHCFYRDIQRYKEKLAAVLSIDLNGLKGINDTHGHAAGDEAICVTAECIRKNLIKGCYLYRTGGDEFTVLCLKYFFTPEQGETMIRNILEDMSKTPYRCSVGIAECRQGEEFDALWARADEAMYKEKQKRKAEKE